MLSREEVEKHYPIDGPHSDDDVRQAAAAVAHLTRYLNHATLPHRAETTLGYPSTIDSVVQDVGTALVRLQQFVGQVAQRAEVFAGDDRLGVDNMGPVPEGGAPVVALTLAHALQDLAGALGEAETPLRQAGAAAHRLEYNG